MHCGMDAVGEEAVGAGSDQLNLVVPGPLIHKYIVMDSSHVDYLPGCPGLPARLL